MTEQLQLGLGARRSGRLFHVEPDDGRVHAFVELLKLGGWLTRKELAEQLGWDERLIRAVAEAAGDKVIRGQKGFAYFENATVEEINHSAEQAISQGRIMIKYGVGLKKRVHGRVGT